MGKSGDGFLMVYSVTDSSSLEDVKDRYQSMLESTSSTPQTCKPVLFIGNKCDLDNDRVISKEQGREGGRIGHHETSAKNNIMVTEVFQDIVRLIKRGETEKSPNTKDSGGCCCIIV